jgi:GH43 family beta-xylosidase
MGPWSDGGNLEEAKVLSGKGNNLIGPGHNSVAEKAFGETDFIVYHSWNEERTKRMMCIDPIEWTSDGPRAVNPSFGDKTVTKE